MAPSLEIAARSAELETMRLAVNVPPSSAGLFWTIARFAFVEVASTGAGANGRASKNVASSIVTFGMIRVFTFYALPVSHDGCTNIRVTHWEWAGIPAEIDGQPYQPAVTPGSTIPSFPGLSRRITFAFLDAFFNDQS